MFLCFVDLKQAFDRVRLGDVLNNLGKRGISQKCIKVKTEFPCSSTVIGSSRFVSAEEDTSARKTVRSGSESRPRRWYLARRAPATAGRNRQPSRCGCLVRLNFKQHVLATCVPLTQRMFSGYRGSLCLAILGGC